MAKKKRTKLPKRILGVKLPKKLRRGSAADFLMSRFGQVLVAEAISHAGALLARNQTRSGSLMRSFAEHPLEALREAGQGAAETAADATKSAEGGAANVYEALSEAARHFIATLQGDEDSPVKVPPKARKGKRQDDAGVRH